MRKALSRLTAVTLMSAVLVTGSFAMSGEAAFAASKLPEKPKITKAAAVNNNTVNLKWSKAKNAEKYKIYRKKADGRFVLVKTTAKRECRNKKLAYGTRYAYKVTALSKAGRKSTSRIKVVFTKPEKPVITAKVQGINGVKVTWKSTKGAIKYKVYRRKTGGKYVLVKTTTALSYTNKKTAYDTKYTYKVKAVSKAGKMTESAAKTVVTGKKPAVPDEPSVPVTPDCAIVGHHFQVEKEAAPTCTSSGYTEYKCGRCPVTKKEAGALAFGHRWHITGMKPSTFTEEGYTKYGCYRCEKTKEEVIPKKEQLVTPF
ncbi:MAG: hypothetical protein IJ987_04295, partial [Firmicutes bacterium]|nr:hypothetical protein [Bacillota bacterium]